MTLFMQFIYQFLVANSSLNKLFYRQSPMTKEITNNYNTMWEKEIRYNSEKNISYTDKHQYLEICQELGCFFGLCADLDLPCSVYDCEVCMGAHEVKGADVRRIGAWTISARPSSTDHQALLANCQPWKPWTGCGVETKERWNVSFLFSFDSIGQRPHIQRIPCWSIANDIIPPALMAIACKFIVNHHLVVQNITSCNQ